MSAKNKTDKTDEAIKEALAGSGFSFPVIAVTNYLRSLMKHHGADFDPDHALNDLSETVEMFKKEIKK